MFLTPTWGSVMFISSQNVFAKSSGSESKLPRSWKVNVYRYYKYMILEIYFKKENEKI